METVESRVKLAQAASAQLRQYLHTLPPEAWRRPSACHRWEVRDVVGHLILVAELYLDVISRGLQGDTSPRLASRRLGPPMRRLGRPSSAR